MAIATSPLLKEHLPLVRHDLRRLTEKACVSAKIGTKHRKISIGHVFLSGARLVFQPFGLAFRAVGRILMLFITLIASIAVKKQRPEIAKWALGSADALICIPLNIITNFGMIFKHLAGLINPKVCYRPATKEEKAIMAEYKIAQKVGNRYLRKLKQLPVKERKLVNMKRIEQLRKIHPEFASDVEFMHRKYPQILRDHRDLRIYT